MIKITMGLLVNGDEKTKVYEDSIDNFSLSLNKELVYDIGIDQSTSCTGIAICPLDKSYVGIIEVLNLNKDYYYTVRLRNLIETIFKDCKIRYFIMEEPLNFVSGRRNKVLSNLKDYLSELKGKLDIKHFDTINPPSWRKGLMPKAIEGDRRKKDTVVKTVVEMYPGLANFCMHCNYDYDGIESLGIITGYKLRHGLDEENGTVKILGQKNTLKEAVSFFRYCDTNSSDLYSVMQEVLRVPKEVTIGRGDISFKTYNEEENLYNNAKMSLVDDFTFTLVEDELDVISCLIRMGQTPKPNHTLFMFTVHKKLCTESFIKYLYHDGYFPVLFQ